MVWLLKVAVAEKHLTLRSVRGEVLHHLSCKTENNAHQSPNIMVNFEVAPIARPFLSVDTLNKQQKRFGNVKNSFRHHMASAHSRTSSTMTNTVRVAENRA